MLSLILEVYPAIETGSRQVDDPNTAQLLVISVEAGGRVPCRLQGGRRVDL